VGEDQKHLLQLPFNSDLVHSNENVTEAPVGFGVVMLEGWLWLTKKRVSGRDQAVHFFELDGLLPPQSSFHHPHSFISLPHALHQQSGSSPPPCQPLRSTTPPLGLPMISELNSTYPACGILEGKSGLPSD
jgi:hypothetical protein